MLRIPGVERQSGLRGILERCVERRKQSISRLPRWRYPLIGYLLCIPLLGFGLYPGIASSGWIGVLQILTFILAGIIILVIANQRKAAERQAVQMAAQQAGQLKRIFETISDGLIVYDREGRIMQMNAAIRRMLGMDLQPVDYYSRSPTERASLYSLRDEHGQPLNVEQSPVMQVLRGEELTGNNTMDIRLSTPDGRELQLNVSGASLRDQAGQVAGAVCVFRDVTERRQLEQRTHETNQRMTEFLGIASHELRTPLTTIKGNLQLSQGRVKNLLRHDVAMSNDFADTLALVQNLLERAERQVGVQNRLVGDLLDVSGIQTNNLELVKEPCDLLAIVREAVEDQRLLASTRTISLALPPLETLLITGDAGRLGQVVNNYLTNALKYSAADRPVEVCVEIEGGLVRVLVRDEGPGLPLAEQERIWERFYRVPGISVRSGSGVGLGLGLYISRTIIERHGGQVGVESTPGRGSTFWFTLPLAE